MTIGELTLRLLVVCLLFVLVVGTYNSGYGAEDILVLVHGTGAACRLYVAPLVGAGGYDSDWICFVVDRLPERVV